MKVQLELTERQAAVIQEALEAYSRLGMGQINALDQYIYPWRDVNYEKKEQVLEEVRKLYFPELFSNSYYGIRSPEIREEFREAWDIIQVMRHQISWYKKPKGGITVNFDPPFQTAKEPLPQCTIIEEKKDGKNHDLHHPKQSQRTRTEF